MECGRWQRFISLKPIADGSLLSLLKTINRDARGPRTVPTQFLGGHPLDGFGIMAVAELEEQLAVDMLNTHATADDSIQSQGNMRAISSAAQSVSPGTVSPNSQPSERLA